MAGIWDSSSLYSHRASGNSKCIGLLFFSRGCHGLSFLRGCIWQLPVAVAFFSIQVRLPILISIQSSATTWIHLKRDCWDVDNLILISLTCNSHLFTKGKLVQFFSCSSPFLVMIQYEENGFAFTAFCHSFIWDTLMLDWFKLYWIQLTKCSAPLLFVFWFL